MCRKPCSCVPFTVWTVLQFCREFKMGKPCISPGYSVSKQSLRLPEPPSLHSYCIFGIRSFSDGIATSLGPSPRPTCECIHVGLGGPHRPAYTCSPKNTLGYHRSMFIYISPSQISQKSQQQLPKAECLRLLETPKGSFNDGCISYSQRLPLR